jgi:protein-disulfide isomerase
MFKRITRSIALVALAAVIVAALPGTAAAQSQPPTPTPTPGSALGSIFDNVTSALTGGTPTAEPPPFLLDLDDVPMTRGDDGAFILGDPEAPVTLVVFADWACPHCQTYEMSVIKTFVEEYVMTGQARLEHRIFPTAGGPTTIGNARTAECIDNIVPGSFWQTSALLYELALAGDYAQASDFLIVYYDLETEEVAACLEKVEQYAVDVEYGETIGVRGTPAVFVRYADDALEDAAYIEMDGVIYNRGGVPLEVLAQVVERALAPGQAA